jgi:hypothetical protein
MISNLIAYASRKAEEKRQRQAKCAKFLEKNFKLMDNGMYWQLDNPNYLQEANDLK